MDRGAATGIQFGVIGFGLMLIYSGFNTFVLMGTADGVAAFFLTWAFFITTTLGCAATGILLGKVMDLSNRPYWVVFGWLGFVLAGEALIVIVVDIFLYFASFASDPLATGSGTTPDTGINIFGMGCFLLFMVIAYGAFAIAVVNAIESPRSWGYSLVLFTNLLIWIIIVSLVFWVLGGFNSILTPPPTDASRFAYARRAVSNVGVLQPFTYARAMGLIRRLEEADQAEVTLREVQRQQTIQAEERAKIKAKEDEYNALTAVEKAYRKLDGEKPGPKFADILRELIRDRFKYNTKEFAEKYTQLMQKSSDKQLFLDLCIDEQADALAETTYITMLKEVGFQHAAEVLINTYLFKPGLGTPAAVLASYAANASVTRTRIKAAKEDEKNVFLKSAYEAISSNTSGSENLIPILLNLADDKTRQEIYALALKPNTNEHAVQAITDDWLANSPDTFVDYFRIYFKIKGSQDLASFEREELQTLSKVTTPDRRIQEPMAAALLSAARNDPSAPKLAALTKWQTERTKRAVIDTLMSISSEAQLNSKDNEFKVATALDLTEPLDHIVGLALKATWHSPAVLGYLRHDATRVERIVLSAMDKKDNRIPECESEIRLLEQTGWKTAKQRFVDLYKVARTLSDRQRMTTAEANISRQISLTLRTSPDDNPDVQRLKTITTAKPSTEFSSKPGFANPPPPDNTVADSTEAKAPPKAAESTEIKSVKSLTKLDMGDVIQIKTLGNLEYAVVTSVDTDLISVTLINRGNKADYIPLERILMIVGRSDDAPLITRLKAEAAPTAGPEASRNADKAAALPAGPTKPLIGMKVEVQHLNDWYPAVIQRITDDKCFVSFDDKTIGSDNWFTLNNIRPRGSKKNFLLLGIE